MRSERQDASEVRQHAHALASLLRVLGNADRVMLLHVLAFSGEMGVTELGTLAQVEQPTLSQQLKVLRQAGLVRSCRQQKRKLYSLSSPAINDLLDGMWALGERVSLFKSAAGHMPIA